MHPMFWSLILYNSKRPVKSNIIRIFVKISKYLE